MEPTSEISWLIKAVLRDTEAVLKESPEESFKNDLESLKEWMIKVQKIQASLNTKSQSVFLQRIRDLAYNAQDLLDEWDYCRIQGDVERGGNSHSNDRSIEGVKVSPSNDRSIEGVKASPSNDRSIEVTKASSPSNGGGNEDSEDCSASIGGDNKGSKLPSLLKQAGNIFSKVKRSTSKKKGAASPVPLSDMARRMKDLVGSLHKAYNDTGHASKSEAFDSASLSNLETQPKKPMPTMNSLFAGAPVFGRDKERDRLVLQLLTAHESTDKAALSVLSVVGLAGVGKTTLAQLVYDDPRVKTRFEVQMWVTARSNFGASRVACEMVQQVCECDDSHVEAKSLDELLKEIGDGLRSKRFLLVVDDWQEGFQEEWKPVLNYLKQSSTTMEGSVILVTARVQSVVVGVNELDPVSLYGLEDSDFWDLFKSLTFDEEWFDRNLNLEIIGRQIAKKLKGNPLLAKTISASLKRDLDKAHWGGVLDALNLVGGNAISPVLKLSYQNLPFGLKQCFSYSALFPKDYPFNREDLICLWIAHGFVEGRMEDVGCEYFDSLVDQGFLKRVYRKNPTPGLSEYRTHDLVHEVGQRSGPTPSVVHHISFIMKDKKLDEHAKSVKGEYLRSFILLGGRGSIDPNVVDNVLSRIKEPKGLRVFRLNVTHMSPPILANMGKYIHLRYLSLDSDFEILPEEICKLYHLLFLDVSHCTKLTSLPEKFNNLVKLRHFIAKKEMHSRISNVRKLTSLQELIEFQVKTGSAFGIEQLGDLEDLGGSLSIYNLKNVGSKEEALKARLDEKVFLNSLCLSWRGNGAEKEKEETEKAKEKEMEKDTEKKKETEKEKEKEKEKEIEIEIATEEEKENEKRKEKDVLEGLQPHVDLKSLEISGYHGNNMPSWLNDIDSLVSVYLQNCSELEALPPLGELPFLKKLHLKSLRKVSKIGPQLYGNSENGLGFQSLEEILIENMKGLVSWHWRDKTVLFPALQVLEIKDCPELTNIPLSTLDSLEIEGNKRFPCLNTLVINDCPKVKKIPFLPHTHRLSRISINGVPLFGKLDLSVSRGDFVLNVSSIRDLKSLDELLLFYNLRSLTSLCIKGCPDLEKLGGEDIFALVCLNKLRIEECTKLDSLCINPSDLTQLLSLEKLSIVGCQSMKSFPEDDLPDSLKELNVDKCSSELHEICERIKSKGKINVQLGGGDLMM